MKLGVVVPTLNEAEKIDKLMKHLPAQVKVVVVDDLSNDGTAIEAKRLGAFVPFHTQRLGYGRSLVEGLCLAWYTLGCDLVMEMDADHPIDQLLNFLRLAPEFDVVVGKEQMNVHRKVTKLLVNLLGIKHLSHPTCGLVLWSQKVLEKMPWRHVKAKGDGIHIELLFWASKNGFTIGEVEFSGHAGERSYGVMRPFRWLVTWFRLFRLKYLWWWHNF